MNYLEAFFKGHIHSLMFKIVWWTTRTRWVILTYREIICECSQIGGYIKAKIRLLNANRVSQAGVQQQQQMRSSG